MLKIKVQFLSCLLLFSAISCSNYAANPQSPTSISPTTATLEPPLRSYNLVIINPPPIELKLPFLVVDSNGTLYLTAEKDNISKYSSASRPILNTNGCLIDTVTATYSPDYHYLTIAKRCVASEGYESVYLVHSDGVGLIRTIIGYDGYEAGTNRPIEWAPDSKSLLYYRAGGFSDAHVEVFTGLFRYEIETAERKYLTKLWGKYRWSLDGKWIAILDEYSNNKCSTLYVLDSNSESLWELDNICRHSNTYVGIIWQTSEDRRYILFIEEKEMGTETVTFIKKYEFENLPPGKQVSLH